MTEARLAALGCTLVLETRCAHSIGELESHIRAALGHPIDLLLIHGASAILDRRDVIPAAIVAAGGRVDHFGMPVDPGNLLLLGHVGELAVLGLPGCARSPKVNGFDWVLERLVAGLPVGPAEIMRMGAGGLLAEIPSRPLPRAEAKPPAPQQKETPPGPRIGALLLAAGQSRRMGGPNKLLEEIDGDADGGAGGTAAAGLAGAADRRRARQQGRRDRCRSRQAADRAGAQPRLCRGAVDLAEARHGGVAARISTARWCASATCRSSPAGTSTG